MDDLLAEWGIAVSYESFGYGATVTVLKCHMNPLENVDENALVQIRWTGQCIITVYGEVSNLFRLGRHLTRAMLYREFRTRAFMNGKRWRVSNLSLMVMAETVDQI